MTSSEDDTGTGRLLRGGRMVARLLLVWLLVAVALLYGVLSAVVWPLVLRFALPIPVFTLGIGSPLLLGAGILALWFVVPGVVIANLRTAVIVVIVMSVVGSTVSSLLALDEDELFLRRAARRFRRVGDGDRDEPPGVLLLRARTRPTPRRSSGGTRTAAVCSRVAARRAAACSPATPTTSASR